MFALVSMKQSFYLFLFIPIFFCCQYAIAQDSGVTVSVHTDPRLSILLTKTQSIARASSKKEAATRNYESENATKVILKNADAISSNKETPDKNKLIKPIKDPIKPDDNDKTAIKKYIAGTSRGGPYSGPGYRVQIYNGYDRHKAALIKAEFMRNYPGVPTYLTYISPNFRVKVGDFRNRSDAVGMYREASSSYTPCMIVPDHISINNN